MNKVAIGPVTGYTLFYMGFIAIGPVVTCFSIFTHVHVTFFAFLSSHHFVVPSIRFAGRILVFYVQFLWKDKHI